MNKDNRTPLFRMAKRIAIPPYFEMSVSVTTRKARLIHIAPQPNIIRDRMVLLVLGLFKALPAVAIPILVANLSTKPNTLLNEMIIGDVSDFLDMTVHWNQLPLFLRRKERKRKTSPFRVQALPSIKRKNSPEMTKWTSISKIETVDEDKLEADLRGNVNIDEQYVENRLEILDMIVKFQHKWEGNLSRSDMTIYCIELTSPDGLFVISAPY